MSITKDTSKFRTHQAMTRVTYDVGRTVINPAGKRVVEQEERTAGANLMVANGGVFHNGARIA